MLYNVYMVNYMTFKVNALLLVSKLSCLKSNQTNGLH